MSDEALPFLGLMERVREGSNSSSSLKTGVWLSSGPFILLRSNAGWAIVHRGDEGGRRKYESVLG